MTEHVQSIDLTTEEYSEVMTLLRRYIPDVEVWAYGSRVKHTAKPYSDLDIVTFANDENACAVSDLREAFEDSFLSFRVDLFIWNEIPEDFRKNIKLEHIVLQGEK